MSKMSIAQDVTLIEGTVTLDYHEFWFFGDEIENTEEQFNIVCSLYESYMLLSKSIKGTAFKNTRIIKKLRKMSSMPAFIEVLNEEINKIVLNGTYPMTKQ